jgi:3-hydroxybutyryl-CoA dehydrogenase
MNNKIPIGTVGLGLMGSSIATCLLAAGHCVTGLTNDMSQSSAARERIADALLQLQQEGLLKEKLPVVLERLTITGNIELLSNHDVVIESIHENVNDKKQLFSNLEKVLSPSAIIGSNTSAIPVTILQSGLQYPERLLGIHWGEPAHVLRFMEVICGNETDIKNAEKIMLLAQGWGKEPSLLKKDIRGFITNRLMYAMIREGLYLVENGYAEYEDIDRACRNDFGYWITFAGIFRFMDLTGLPAYLTVMKELFPDLNNATEPSQLMEQLVKSGAKGISNSTGFYGYTKETAAQWEKLFVNFTYEIRKLAEKYPQNVGDSIV